MVIALAEVLTGIFAWRGSATGASSRPALILLVFAIGYLYALGVFTVRWRRRA